MTQTFSFPKYLLGRIYHSIDKLSNIKITNNIVTNTEAVIMVRTQPSPAIDVDVCRMETEYKSQWRFTNSSYQYPKDTKTKTQNYSHPEYTQMLKTWNTVPYTGTYCQS